jgi:hypothetical protein
MPNTDSVSPEAAEILEDLIGGPLEVGEYKADCPAHASVSGQSLSVTITEDKVLINCFAGCQTGDVLDALGLKYPDLFLSPTRSHGGKRIRNLSSPISLGLPRSTPTPPPPGNLYLVP